VSKWVCDIIGNFSNGIYKGNLYRVLGVRITFKNLVQDNFLSQYVLEPTRGENVLDIVLTSEKEFEIDCIVDTFVPLHKTCETV